MVWVVLAMALLWVWGVSREDVRYAPPPQQTALPVSSADVLFVDGPRGRIDVLNAKTQMTLAVFESGEGSFLRGILRSLVRERSVRDLHSGGTFSLSLLDNGSLVISDPDTGYWMALEAFGVDNRGLFADILARAVSNDIAATGKTQ